MNPVVVSSVVRTIPGFCQPVSSLSHLVAAAVALIAAVPMMRLARGSTWRVVALGVYVSCMIGTLAISGTYHSIGRDAPARLFMQRLDHYAIWALIAGTFTAVHGVMCRGFWRTGVLVFVWAYAVVGVALQMWCFEVMCGTTGLLLYLGLGWVGLISVFKIGKQIGFGAVRPVWYAGIAFSAGALLEVFGQPVLIQDWVGPHEIFHVAVIAGLTLHWLFVRRLLMRHPAAATAPGV